MSFTVFQPQGGAFVAKYLYIIPSPHSGSSCSAGARECSAGRRCWAHTAGRPSMTFARVTQ
jgi:hypothetical protein